MDHAAGDKEIRYLLILEILYFKSFWGRLGQGRTPLSVNWHDLGYKR